LVDEQGNNLKPTLTVKDSQGLQNRFDKFIQTASKDNKTRAAEYVVQEALKLGSLFDSSLLKWAEATSRKYGLSSEIQTVAAKRYLGALPGELINNAIVVQSEKPKEEKKHESFKAGQLPEKEIQDLFNAADAAPLRRIAEEKKHAERLKIYNPESALKEYEAEALRVLSQTKRKKEEIEQTVLAGKSEFLFLSGKFQEGRESSFELLKSLLPMTQDLKNQDHKVPLGRYQLEGFYKNIQALPKEKQILYRETLAKIVGSYISELEARGGDAFRKADANFAQSLLQRIAITNEDQVTALGYKARFLHLEGFDSQAIATYQEARKRISGESKISIAYQKRLFKEEAQLLLELSPERRGEKLSILAREAEMAFPRQRALQAEL